MQIIKITREEATEFILELPAILDSYLIINTGFISIYHTQNNDNYIITIFNLNSKDYFYVIKSPTNIFPSSFQDELKKFLNEFEIFKCK